MSMDRHLSFMELLDRIQHALNKHDLRTVDRSSTAMHMGLR